MNKEKLKEKIKEIDTQLDKKLIEDYKISEQIEDLNSKRNELQHKLNSIISEELNMQPNQWYVCYDQQNYHYCIFSVIKINEVGKFIKFNQYTYRDDDGDMSFRATQTKECKTDFYETLTDHGYKLIDEQKANELFQTALNFQNLKTNVEFVD